MRLARLPPVDRRQPLAPGTGDARRAITLRESLICELADGEGHVGRGEAAPLPGSSLETLAEVVRAHSALPAGWSLETAAAIELAQAPSLRFALETARLDLLAQRAGRSLEAELGGPRRQRQATAQLIVDLARLDELEITADRPIKLKLGHPGRSKDELAALRRFRARVGPRVEIRVDANGAWSKLEWLRLAPALAELDLAWVEDPVATEVWVDLPRSPVPLAVDAPLSVGERPACLRILERDDVAAVVLKPSLLGGLMACRHQAEDAARRGQAAVYSHAYEGPVGYSAIAAACLSDPHAGVAAGLAPHSGLSDAAASLERLEGAFLIPGRTAGLGLIEAPA